eukprot:TRINITY_DN9183_c0_g1_i2.p1 TRINITY_DN9183_c0_g1~~TRINITY_DN9183_c0_g1_i2.p1  ORF type:complete len:187 (+),score=43.11 TRINITY_DN9183_c0_g1_i2:222-782(+)
MAITILGHPISTCTKRVLVVLEEKNVTDYTVETIDVLAGAHKKPEFLAKQPFGQIPVLEDGDISIYESRAMARYVCDKYDGEGTALFGKTPKEKAAVNQWLEVEGQTFNGPISAIVVELVFKKHHGKEADEAKVAEAAAQLGLSDGRRLFERASGLAVRFGECKDFTVVPDPDSSPDYLGCSLIPT